MNSCLHAHILWHSLYCLLDTRHININLTFREYNDASDQICTTVYFWSDGMDKGRYHAARATQHCHPEEANTVLIAHPSMTLVF